MNDKPVVGKCNSLIRNWERRFGKKKYCGNFPKKQRKRCGYHGGKSPRGMDSPQFVEGSRSQAFPDRYYAESLNFVSDDLLEQTKMDINTLEVRITELRASLVSPVGTGVIEKLNVTYEKIVESAESGADTVQTIKILGALLKQLNHNTELWDQMKEMVMQKNRLIDSEHRRIMDTYESITLDQMLILARQIVSILKEEITDKETGRRINERIRGLLPQSTTEPVVH